MTATRSGLVISPAAVVRAVAEWMRTRPRGETAIIAIDGPGGAGKSTLARAVARAMADREVAIVHADDFYLPSRDRPPVERHGIDVDLARLREQVIDPLSAGRAARYQRYDWPSDALAEWHDVIPGGAVIIEGVGAAARTLRDALDLIIWVDAPPAVRLRRGLARDGERARELWERKWLPAEEQYVATQQPDVTAHFRVDGLLPYDSPS